jgi:hypothetical protein
VVGPSEAVTEVIGAIRGVLGLTRQSRLREQINDTTELYGKVKGHNALDSAAADIARVVKLQTSRLLATAEPASRRAWAWGPFTVGLVFTLLAAAGAWALYQYVDRAGWWIWLAIVPVALLALLCLAASLALLLERKPAAEPPATD